MRKIIAVGALICSAVACGELLGADGEDGQNPVPADGGAETAADASGGSTVDAALVCETLTEDFAAFTENAQLPGANWRRFFGETNCGLLGFDGGAFVAEIPATADGGGPCTSTNAGIFRRFDAGVKTIECEVDVRVNSFDGIGVFLEYRVEQGTSYSLYRASAGWTPQGTTGRATSTLADGGSPTDDPKSVPGIRPPERPFAYARGST